MKLLTSIKAAVLFAAICVPALADFDNWFFEFSGGSGKIKYTGYDKEGEPIIVMYVTKLKSDVKRGVLTQKIRTSCKETDTDTVSISTLEKVAENKYEGGYEEDLFGLPVKGKLKLTLKPNKKYEQNIHLSTGARIEAKGYLDDDNKLHQWTKVFGPDGKLVIPDFETYGVYECMVGEQNICEEAEPSKEDAEKDLTIVRYEITDRHLNHFGLSEESCSPEIRGGYEKYGVVFQEGAQMHLEEEATVIVIKAHKAEHELISAINLLIEKGYRIIPPAK